MGEGGGVGPQKSVAHRQIKWKFLACELCKYGVYLRIYFILVLNHLGSMTINDITYLICWQLIRHVKFYIIYSLYNINIYIIIILYIFLFIIYKYHSKKSMTPHTAAVSVCQHTTELFTAQLNIAVRWLCIATGRALLRVGAHVKRRLRSLASDHITPLDLKDIWRPCSIASSMCPLLRPQTRLLGGDNMQLPTWELNIQEALEFCLCKLTPPGCESYPSRVSL